MPYFSNVFWFNKIAFFQRSIAPLAIQYMCYIGVNCYPSFSISLGNWSAIISLLLVYNVCRESDPSLSEFYWKAHCRPSGLRFSFSFTKPHQTRILSSIRKHILYVCMYMSMYYNRVPSRRFYFGIRLNVTCR